MRYILLAIIAIAPLCAQAQTPFKDSIAAPGLTVRTDQSGVTSASVTNANPNGFSEVQFFNDQGTGKVAVGLAGSANGSVAYYYNDLGGMSHRANGNMDFLLGAWPGTLYESFLLGGGINMKAVVPGTPGTGYGTFYLDPTAKVGMMKNESGTSSVMVLPQDCSTTGHVSKINSDGSVTCSADGTTGQGASYYQTVVNPSGTAQTQRAKLQFTGSGVASVSDNGSDTTVVTINGGSSNGTGSVNYPILSGSYPASTITLGGNCATTACVVFQNGSVATVVSAANTVTAPSGSGKAYFFATDAATEVVGTNGATATIAGSGPLVGNTSTTGFFTAGNALPRFIIGSADYSNGQWTHFDNTPGVVSNGLLEGAGINLGYSATNIIVAVDPSAVMTYVSVPSSSSASCTANQYSFDSSYLYLCVAANTWRRFSGSSW